MKRIEYSQELNSGKKLDGVITGKVYPDFSATLKFVSSFFLLFYSFTLPFTFIT